MSAWIPALAPAGGVSIRWDPTSVSAVETATGPGMGDVLVSCSGCLCAAPHGSALCKSQKEQGHRQHPFPVGSQPAWLGHSTLVAWVVGTALSTLPCHVALCCVTQMWMSALWRGLVLMDGVSTWMAPSAVPATGVTRWHLTRRAAKVPGSRVQTF